MSISERIARGDGRKPGTRGPGTICGTCRFCVSRHDKLNAANLFLRGRPAAVSSIRLTIQKSYCANHSARTSPRMWCPQHLPAKPNP